MSTSLLRVRAVTTSSSVEGSVGLRYVRGWEWDMHSHEDEMELPSGRGKWRKKNAITNIVFHIESL